MTHTYTVPEGIRHLRADKALAIAFPDHSRTALQRAFDSGLVTLRGAAIKRDQSVTGGDTLDFAMPDLVAATLRAVDIPLDVIYEDKHLLAVNKASGMVVHPGAATGEDTLVHALLAHCAGSLSGVGGVERPGIVHRLDRETTGLIIVAKNDKAHRVSWLLSGASIPKGMFVLHKCDVRNCVRPDHLFIGDNAINIADMVRKGRSCLNAPYGESCHSAKLRESQIIEIRARTDLSVAQASELFETSKSNIRFIRSGRTWRHVK